MVRKDYVDQRLSDLFRYHDKTVSDIQAEVDRRMAGVARELDMRFELVTEKLHQLNQIRELMADQAAHFVPRETIDTQFAEVGGRLDRLDAGVERARGRAAVYAGLVTVVGLIVTIVALVINHVQF